ncbi:MAG: helix-turn-helix domain protein [Candidatus Gottesmanbacteria bacterium GW2011_GWA2_43_14]|uniref:Helix-turn-helix domain protein n=1 Tax=Candidatus Gottesmanbacteria bacterium GW2011_GWA2_43_14 TaxID=1618443 RepID=A0A0G1DJK8_9BACT|nr:MAG: helix-turn-helix domain protein [Candidatus Gottesmanbacteria bacterium GW2011_GWA2_43_14]
MKNKLYTFEDDLNRRLKNPKFKKAWVESEPEYQLAKQLMAKRLARKISQRELAKKLNTSQAVVSRIETMRANPSLSLLKRIAEELGSKLIVLFV